MQNRIGLGMGPRLMANQQLMQYLQPRGRGGIIPARGAIRGQSLGDEIGAGMAGLGRGLQQYAAGQQLQQKQAQQQAARDARGAYVQNMLGQNQQATQSAAMGAPVAGAPMGGPTRAAALEMARGSGPQSNQALMQLAQDDPDTAFALLNERMRRPEEKFGLVDLYNPETGETRTLVNREANVSPLIQRGWISADRAPKPEREGQRRIVEGADGFKYYADTAERVLPGVTVQPKPEREGQRRIVEGADGRKYYADTQELVLPGVTVPEDAPDTPSAMDLFKQEKDLRGEVTKALGDFRDIDAAYGRMEASAEDPSPAGDLAIIFNYMKMLDPGSTVREGEFATAQNAGGIDDRLRAQYNNILEGTRLTENQRSDFMNRAGRLYNRATETAQGTIDRYERLSREYGADPGRVVPERPELVDIVPRVESEEDEAKRVRGMTPEQATEYLQGVDDASKLPNPVLDALGAIFGWDDG